MTATIGPEEWLSFLEAEYLNDFIREGGASVKFAVPMDGGLRAEIERGLVLRARDAGYIVAQVSSAETRIHMIDQVFFKVAEQVRWPQLVERIITNLAEKAGYAPPEEGENALVDRLAAANGIGQQMFLSSARPWIEKGIFHQKRLAKDFRVAMTHLSLARLSGGPDGETTTETIIDWLTGRNRAISAVKPYSIFSRVSRNNARHMLESLLHMVRLAGYPGILIVLDISRVAVPRNPHDGMVFYTRAAMLDAYEMLRQFIDATDRMKGALVVVMPDAEFLDGDRGIETYDALRLRVYDEVRDSRLVNPMGALVRLSA